MQRGYCIYSKNKSMWVWALRNVDVNIPNGIKEAIENSTSVAKKCISSKLCICKYTKQYQRAKVIVQSSLQTIHMVMSGGKHQQYKAVFQTIHWSLSLSFFYSNGLIKRAIISPFDWDPSSFVIVSNNKSSP